MRIFLCVIITCFYFMLSGQNKQNELRFTSQSNININIDYPYLLHIPSNIKSKSESGWPLLVFLHGSGERGDDYELLKKHGPPMKVAKGEDMPFVVLTPQCPLNQRWNPYAVNALIDHIIENHPIDTSRIYITGLSMGGYGTWDLAIKYPHKFAAIAPICGGSDTNAWDAPNTISHLPIWAFHGALDEVVPFDNTVRIIKRLKESGSNPLLTIYPEAGHDSWTKTYNNPKLYEWLLSHRLK